MILTAKARRVLTTVMMAMTLMALPAFACELAGPNTHVGVIKAIDLAESSFTLFDQQAKKPFIFLADPVQLNGLSLGQVVMVKYSETKGRLKAEEIKPL